MNRTVVSLMIAAVIIAGAGQVVATRAQQQARADSTATLLTDLTANNTPFTITFTEAIPRLGKSVDIGPGQPLSLSDIGSDIACFTLLSQAAIQKTCVPYAQIVTLTYAE